MEDAMMMFVLVRGADRVLQNKFGQGARQEGSTEMTFFNLQSVFCGISALYEHTGGAGGVCFVRLRTLSAAK